MAMAYPFSKLFLLVLSLKLNAYYYSLLFPNLFPTEVLFLAQYKTGTLCKTTFLSEGTL